VISVSKFAFKYNIWEITQQQSYKQERALCGYYSYCFFLPEEGSGGGFNTMSPSTSLMVSTAHTAPTAP
jgi:hypothetical protein